jgi:hypothetical protein
MSAISNTIACPICLDNILPTDEIFRAHHSISKVEHLFHQVCILPWLDKKDEPSCPLCRESIFAQEDIDISFTSDESSALFITSERISTALLYGGHSFLSRVVQETPDDEIVRVAKEAAQFHQLDVVNFLLTNRLSARAGLYRT